MREFVYEGIKEGKRVKGRTKANSRRSVLDKLRSEGITPISVEEASDKVPFWRREFSFKRVSEEELSFILLQVATLLESGIPLSRALELLGTQAEDQRIGSALLEIKADIDRGESISNAFRKSGIFPEFLSEMLTAAETGENLERIFEIAGRHLETVADMKGKIVSAVTYPSVVIGFSLVALFVAIKFVVPRIARILEGFGKELPLVTKAVILFSDILTYLLYLSPLLVLVFIYRERFVSKEKIHEILLKIPVVGKIGFYFNLSRFAYTLYMTLLSAVPITTAYSIAVRSVSNLHMRKVLEGVLEDIERGKSISSLLKGTGMFPPLFINLVETGESSGELEKMLRLVSEVYKKEAIRTINTWIRLVEPFSILLIGVIVGIMVVSVLLPLTEITSGIGR